MSSHLRRRIRCIEFNDLRAKIHNLFSILDSSNYPSLWENVRREVLNLNLNLFILIL